MANIYNQIEESLSDGYSDAEAIAIRTGLDVSTVEGYLDAGKESGKASSRKGRVLEDLREVDSLIKISQAAFRERPGQSHATALQMLMNARRALRAELDSTADPADQVRSLDETIIVPFLKAVILAAGSSFRSTIDEGTHFMDASQVARLQDLVQRQYRLMGGEVQKAYEALHTSLLRHFQTAEADGYALLEASRAEVAASRASLPAKARKELERGRSGTEKVRKKPESGRLDAGKAEKGRKMARFHRIAPELRALAAGIRSAFPFI